MKRNTLSLPVVLIIALFPLPSSTRDLAKIETESFMINLMPGWNVQEQTTHKIIMVGPAQEQAQMSSFKIVGGESAQPTPHSRMIMKENLKKAMLAVANDQRYVIVDKLIESGQHGHNSVFLSLKARTRDNRRYFHQFGMVGPSEAVLVTVQGDVANLFNAGLLEYSVRALEWR